MGKPTSERTHKRQAEAGRGPGGAPQSRVCRWPRRAARRVEAAERLAARAARNASEQLAALDRRLGPDVGAGRERRRLVAAEVAATAAAATALKAKARTDGRRGGRVAA